MSFAYLTNGTLSISTSQRSSFNKRITQAGETVNGQRFSSLGAIDALTLLSPSTGIIEVAPVAGGGLTVTPGTGSLVLTGAAPTIRRAALPSVGALTLAAQPPLFRKGALTATGLLTLSGQAPHPVKAALVGKATLTIAGFAPVFSKRLFLGIGAVTLTGFAPGVATVFSFPVGTGLLTLTGLAPIVERVVRLPSLFTRMR